MDAPHLTDNEIADLLAEPKRLPSDLRLRWRAKSRHRELSFPAAAELRAFRLVLRQSLAEGRDFSVILLVRLNSAEFRLRRHNGLSHSHTNKLEATRIRYDYHIHMATERYQLFGDREDDYAEATTRYSTLAGALDCMLADAHIAASEEQRAHLRTALEGPS